LVTLLLKTDPNERLSANEALEHKWFQKIFEEKEDLGSAMDYLAKRKMLK